MNWMAIGKFYLFCLFVAPCMFAMALFPTWWLAWLCTRKVRGKLWSAIRAPGNLGRIVKWRQCYEKHHKGRQ